MHIVFAKLSYLCTIQLIWYRLTYITTVSLIKGLWKSTNFVDIAAYQDLSNIPDIVSVFPDPHRTGSRVLLSTVTIQSLSDSFPQQMALEGLSFAGLPQGSQYLFLFITFHLHLYTAHQKDYWKNCSLQNCIAWPKSLRPHNVHSN